jgi:hypothetical protein
MAFNIKIIYGLIISAILNFESCMPLLVTISSLTKLRISLDSFLDYGPAYSILSLKWAKEADLLSVVPCFKV